MAGNFAMGASPAVVYVRPDFVAQIEEVKPPSNQLKCSLEPGVSTDVVVLSKRVVHKRSW